MKVALLHPVPVDEAAILAASVQEPHLPSTRIGADARVYPRHPTIRSKADALSFTYLSPELHLSRMKYPAWFVHHTIIAAVQKA